MKTIRLILIFCIITISVLIGFTFKPFFGYLCLINYLILLIINRLILNKKQHLTLAFVYLLVIVLFFNVGLFIHLHYLPYCKSEKIIIENTGNNGLKLNSLEKTIDRFNQFKKDTLSFVKYKADSIPIIILEHLSEKYNKKMLIIAGSHGNEPTGCLSIPLIMKEILKNESTSQWRFHLIYALNLIGLINNYRYNEINCDINRDFNQFKTEQAKQLLWYPKMIKMLATEKTGI